MTNTAAKMIDSLIGDLGNNPQVTPIEAIQTVILGVRKMQLGMDDARGMLTALKGYFGTNDRNWAEMVLFCLRDVPEIGEGTRNQIIRPI